jgi:hypothetical protein
LDGLDILRKVEKLKCGNVEMWKCGIISNTDRIGKVFYTV